MANTPFPLLREIRESTVLVGNGTAGPYGPTTFRVFDVADVVVLQKAVPAARFSKAAGVTVIKTAGLAYDTVSVTFAAAVPATTQFVIQARRTHERAIAVTKAGMINTTELERELSKQGTVLSELRRDVDNGIQLPPGTGGRSIALLPEGHIPIADADGNLVDGGDMAAFQALAQLADEAAQSAVDAAASATTSASSAVASAAAATQSAVNAAASAADAAASAAEAAAGASEPSNGSVTYLKLDPAIAALIQGSLQKTSNLADVPNKTTALNNLGALQKTSNLADVPDKTAALDNLTYQWGVSGPALALPNYMQRRYVDVGAYCDLNDAVDAHARVQAAFNDGLDREVVFTNPYGGKRRYRSLNRPAGAGITTGVLVMPKRGRIIMEPGAVLDFSSWANSGTPKYHLYAQGTIPTPISLSLNVARGDKIVFVVSPGGLSFTRDSWHILVSDADYTNEDGSIGKKGEWVHINEIQGNVLYISAALRDSYATADNARIYPMTDLVTLSLEGINILGCGTFQADAPGDRGVLLENGIDCRVIGGSIRRSDQLSLLMLSVLNGLIDGVRVEFDLKGSIAVNQYGPTLGNACENVKVTNCEVIGGKEAMGLSGTGGIIGVTRDCIFSHNRMRGAWRSGFCTHDNHENMLFEGNIIEDCEQGVDNRIVGGTYRNNTFRRLGFDGGTLSCAFQLGSGAAKVVIDGNIIEGALRGVYRAPSIKDEIETGPVGEIQITNNVMRQISAYGVSINRNVADDENVLGSINVSNNDITCVTSGSTPWGVVIEGRWNAPVVANNVFRGGNSGAPGRAVYLHNTSAGGSFGPVNPIVVGNSYEDFADPFIAHSTGAWTVRDNVKFNATTLPTVASASGVTPPTSGYVFNITGTATINTIVGAARLAGQQITLIFAASLTVAHNANAGAANDIQLAGAANFAATANDTLTLVSNGTVWREISRAAI